MQLISIVVPAFNEETNLPILYQELQLIFSSAHDYVFEIIFINDGSTDQTWTIIKDLAYRDHNVHGIKLSRNFGHQIALTAAYDVARGDAIISMDADLQDSPHVIIDMIKKWEQGAAVVYARRVDRNDGILKTLTASWYYRLLDTVAEVKIPRNVGDFRLVDKKVVKQLRQCREQSRYLRGLVAWFGFKHDFIDFIRPNRKAGISGYTWKKMIKFALDGLTGFSHFPLKLAGYVGALIVGSGVLLIAQSMIFTLLGYHYMFSEWLLMLIYIFFGVLFLNMWILGEYIGRIYDQENKRPLYIIDELVNINE